MDLAGGADPNGFLVMMGKGNGTFSVSTVGPAQIDGLASGDFDGDGRLDVVTVGGGNILVYPGNGNGSFLPPKLIDSGGGRSVHAVDVDKDGFLDVLLVEPYFVAIYFGSGSFSFLRSIVGTPFNPTSAALADFDKDGVADLVIDGEQSNGGISVLRGDGARGFIPTVFLPPSKGYPADLVVADFDEDGMTDIVVANSGVTSLTLWLGGASFAFAAQPQLAVGSAPGSLEAADVNGDGHLDVVCVNRLSSDSSVLFGLGDGTFKSEVRLPTGFAPFNVTLADFDGDALPDLAFASSEALVVMLNGVNGFRTPTKMDEASLKSLGVFDFDGDGNLDFGSERGIRLGKGDGTFGAAGFLGMNSSRVVFGDLDGDGRVDWVGDGPFDEIKVGRGDGKGGYSIVSSIPVGFVPKQMALGDVDGDSHLDLVLLSSDRVYLMLGDGTGGFGAPIPKTPSFANYTFVAVADVDADGKGDVVFGIGLPGTVTVMSGGVGGNLGASVNYQVTGYPNSVLVTDVDGDGRADIMTGNSEGTLSLLFGKGGGGFSPPQTIKLSVAYAWGMKLGDVDGDGKSDLIATVPGGVVVLSRTGPRTFGPPQVFPVYGVAIDAPVGVGDFDKDGRTDVVAGQSLLLNHGMLACGLAK